MQNFMSFPNDISDDDIMNIQAKCDEQMKFNQSNQSDDVGVFELEVLGTSPKVSNQSWNDSGIRFSPNQNIDGKTENLEEQRPNLKRRAINFEESVDDDTTTSKKRRVLTHNQRLAANYREKKRMGILNNAFDELKCVLPMRIGTKRRRVSRVDIMRMNRLMISKMRFSFLALGVRKCWMNTWESNFN
ncbi:hypothetical protein SNEBB_002117 [Seison nebaliae]|nr:hypothetical protein SNEBB_002117 [Seison nebaliae]